MGKVSSNDTLEWATGQFGTQSAAEDAPIRSSERMVDALPNLGPMSEAVLRRAGIVNGEQLCKLGSARAYIRIKRMYGRASRNLLWALEGAVSNRPPQDMATEEKLSLLLQVEAIERGEREET